MVNSRKLEHGLRMGRAGIPLYAMGIRWDKGVPTPTLWSLL